MENFGLSNDYGIKKHLVYKKDLLGLTEWMLQYSAVFLKLTPFRLFNVECNSKDKESLENEDLLNNLLNMGVDIDRARRRQPGVFNRAVTNEQELKIFLLFKGDSDKEIGSIISRYP